jgi:3-methyladenine DNA glycosylase AlkD
MTATMTRTAVGPGQVTERARAFVDAHRAAAARLGTEAGELVGDPVALIAHLRSGLAHLADPAYRVEIERVAGGIGPIAAVRQPLLRATARGLRTAMRHDRSSTVLDLAGHLLRADLLDLHWIAFELLERVIVEDPERTWQLVRAAARQARDWITVDSLAHVAGRGIVGEAYRWAELEQLVYSPSRWERRLVGSTIATMASAARHRADKDPDVVAAVTDHGLGLIRDLIGDADPDVQKALSWALRSLAALDEPSIVAFLRAEAAVAAETDDGHRAWVIRDSLEKLALSTASDLRSTLGSVRRHHDAPSTSRAADTAAAFIGLGVAVPPAERPIVDRP